MEEEAELKPYVDDSKKMGLGGKHKTVMANSSLMMSAGDEDIVHEQDILDAVQSLVEKHHVEVFERFDRQDQLLAQLLQTLSVESPMAASDSVVKLDTSEANSSSYSKLNVSSGQRFASRWDKDDDQELKEAARSKDLGLERSNTKESLQQQHNSRLKRVVDHVIFEVFFCWVHNGECPFHRHRSATRLFRARKRHWGRVVVHRRTVHIRFYSGAAAARRSKWTSVLLFRAVDLESSGCVHCCDGSLGDSFASDRSRGRPGRGRPGGHWWNVQCEGDTDTSNYSVGKSDAHRTNHEIHQSAQHIGAIHNLHAEIAGMGDGAPLYARVHFRNNLHSGS